jgi:signal transduction histidine kinase
MTEVSPDLLREAFDVFSKASLQLQASYDELKVRADRLAKELAQANEELQKQLTEKERISNFLSNIVQSIRSGILVVAPDNTVALTNELAGELLALEGDPTGSSYDAAIAAGPVLNFLQESLEDPNSTSRTVEVEAGAQSHSRKVLALAFTPVLNRADERVASLLVISDITRLKLLEEQALRTNRLAAMGEMAAQLAHEIRNPLGSIEIFAGLLSRDLKDEQDKKLADNIVIGVKSLNSVVTNMLTFTRTVTISPELLDFNDLVRETLGFLEHVLNVQEIKLDMRLSDDVGEMEVDPELVKQILLNLAQNSIAAMESQQNGVLGVASNAVRMEDGRKAVEVRVTDNGCGISPENLSRIFDPFFSTRKSGTGLGLSVVSQIVEKHGGLIIAESEPGNGTTMKFTLPATLPNV